MSDLKDITENFHGGDPFSIEAHQSVVPVKAIQRQQIKAYLATRADGATCEEVEIALDMSHQTCSARISELRASGELLTIGRRATTSGRTARVHAVV